MTTRERCKACQRISPVGFCVPDDIWFAAVPLELQNRVVCLQCFTGWADEILIEWDRHIEFFPVSLATFVGAAP